METLSLFAPTHDPESGLDGGELFPGKSRRFTVAGLFAGIGGIELGLAEAGHETAMLCEIDATANAVLDARFGGQAARYLDVAHVEIPSEVDLLTAGFPCQDLSQAGMTAGMQGRNSSLVGHVFRLLGKKPVPWLVLENVPFMLRLGRGHTMAYILGELERLGYNWAYRTIDTRAFGLPQRRRRVFIVASQSEDPRTVLFTEDTGTPTEHCSDWTRFACGFYWTEGIRGLGWAVDSVPTLKGGSGLGIPSAPAVVMPDGELVTPSIEVAEQLQGFEPGWSEPAHLAGKPSLRWKLVGNAVSVPVAKWLGGRLARPTEPTDYGAWALGQSDPWPGAAYNVGNGRFGASIGEWPVRVQRKESLADYLADPSARRPLSKKATGGFLSRTERAKLRFPEGFLETVRSHLERVSLSS